MVLIRPNSVPDAGVVYTSNNTRLRINEKMLGRGTLYVNQDSLEWMPTDRPDGLSIQWKTISVHGISTNPKSIYVMLDHKLVWQGVYGDIEYIHGDELLEDQPNGDATDYGSSDAEDMTELWFIPNDPNTVDSIFHSMVDCQALHPDSADSDSDSESEFMEFEPDDSNDDVEGNLQDLNINVERFADAEE